MPTTDQLTSDEVAPAVVDRMLRNVSPRSVPAPGLVSGAELPPEVGERVLRHMLPPLVREELSPELRELRGLRAEVRELRETLDRVAAKVLGPERLLVRVSSDP